MNQLFTKKTPLLKRRDIYLSLALIAVAAVLFLIFAPHGTGVATVQLNGSTLATVDLSQVQSAYEIPVGGAYPLTVLVEPGAISVKQASCPDKICVRTGKISSPGQTIVCLPDKLIISIAGQNKQADGITG